jgi:UDP-N-acetylglucosamine 2-epimerase
VRSWTSFAVGFTAEREFKRGVVSSSADPRILVVVGTRPEAIKMAPVVQALRADERVRTTVAFTGQHDDLVDQVLSVFPLAPDYDLGIMREAQSLYDVAGGCLEGIRDTIHACRPDVVLVQGDTASVFFSALVGFFERIRVGHVEAGLRSGDRQAPWPEEMFRRLTDQLTDFYFAPTPSARRNLVAEGVPEHLIHVTGNTVVDALLDVRGRLGEPTDPTLADLISGPEPFALLTAHRRESFGAPLREVFSAILELLEEHEDLRVLYPVHPNPLVAGPARELLGAHDRIHLMEPLSYPDFVAAMARAAVILSDSGGVQEEAPTFGTPVLVLREVTERPEAVESGCAVLVGTDRNRILEATRSALASSDVRDREGSAAANPFGDGKAGERIADIVIAALTGGSRATDDWAGE